MCEVSFKNHGRGNRYYDVVCNGQLIQRFHGASAKNEANAMCDELNRSYSV